MRRFRCTSPDMARYLILGDTVQLDKETDTDNLNEN